MKRDLRNVTWSASKQYNTGILLDYPPFSQANVGGAPQNPIWNVVHLYRQIPLANYLFSCPLNCGLEKMLVALRMLRHRTIFIAQIAGRINVFCTMFMEVQASS